MHVQGTYLVGRSLTREQFSLAYYWICFVEISLSPPLQFDLIIETNRNPLPIQDVLEVIAEMIYTSRGKQIPIDPGQIRLSPPNLIENPYHKSLSMPYIQIE